MSSTEKISKIETIIPEALAQELCFVRIHTENGIIGNGETYYIPHAVAAVVHDWFAQRLLGANALDIEHHWRFLYERCMNFGGKGAEMRALSAIDLALWDILGKCCNQPIWQLLGGKVRDRMPIYNSSGGRSYGLDAGVAGTGHGWPGMGDMGKPGPLEDNWASINTPGDYAEELLNEGYMGVKVWVLDELARTGIGPLHLNRSELRKCLKPLREIRERVGFDLEIMLDGHGFFQWPSAMRIAEEMREIKPMWMEDVIRPDSIDTIAQYRAEALVPIAVSEMFTNREDYRLALEKRAADYIMIDPTWVGGISEARRITQMANAYNIPVTMHDCTGPLNLFSGLQVCFANSNVVVQETVRAHIRYMYEDLVDTNVVINNGEVLLPEASGLGTNLLPELFNGDNHNYRCSSAP